MILPHSGFSSWTILLTHSTIREKSTQQQQRRGQRRRRRRKEEFYFSSGSNLIVSPVLWRSFELHSWFPLQKWSFCGQGVSNHSWLSASHFLTRPFFCLDGTLVYPKYYYHYSMVVVVVQPVSAIQPRTFSLEPALVLLKHMAAAASCIIGLLNMGVKRGLLQLGQY